jgi:hypothetical protein
MLSGDRKSKTKHEAKLFGQGLIFLIWKTGTQRHGLSGWR